MKTLFNASAMLAALVVYPVHAQARDKSQTYNEQPQLAAAELDTSTVTGTAKRKPVFNTPADVQVLQGREKQKN